MIRINLLPHREARRIQRKKDFVLFCTMAAVVGGAVIFFGGTYLNSRIDNQASRNNFIRAETKKLEDQIKEIANLRQELASLKARQTAVENLQTDRTLPVHLLDELVKHVPEGVHLKVIKQDDMKITLSGIAQSNERVSELLRATAYTTAWLEKPELVEIKSNVLQNPQGRDGRRIYEFQMNALLKRPQKPEDKPAVTADAAAAPKVAGAPTAGTTADAKTSVPGPAAPPAVQPATQPSVLPVNAPHTSSVAPVAANTIPSTVKAGGKP
jgi:type IV pilus assembly protein PilN